jgi:glycosyltransferase involved in cell wall biosynthesis
LNFPLTAYVPLWFPLPSETFIFREVLTLRRLGMPIKVYTLYGEKLKNCSPEMLAEAQNVRRLGLKALPDLLSDLCWWFNRDRAKVLALAREVLARRWCSLEVAGESWWAFLAGFRLARLFAADGVGHIHAPWSGGPATAAWVASRLSGIPFSMAGRAGDIYPPDGALAEKIRDALFVRTNNLANVGYLASQAGGDSAKINLVYNSLTVTNKGQSPVAMTPPYKLMAVGRFARTKGFDVLLGACAILKAQNFPFKLTLVGAGFTGLKLRLLRLRLSLETQVDMPGFLPHDRMAELLATQDMMVVPSVVHSTGDRDGIPNVIMEALSHRLPVVATDVCGIPEVIRHGETGLIAPQNDPQALAQAIRDMAGNRDRALAMAEAGQALVAGMFDPQANAQKLFDLFKSKLGVMAPGNDHGGAPEAGR